MSLLLLLALLDCPAATGFVDRIEGPRALLLTPRGTADIPARCLPRGAHEGTFVVRGAVDGRTFRVEMREVRRLLQEARRPRSTPPAVP